MDYYPFLVVTGSLGCAHDITWVRVVSMHTRQGVSDRAGSVSRHGLLCHDMARGKTGWP